MRPVIETHELTKRFGQFTAVDRLNLTVEEGEIFGLLGPNGSGKTTTMRMLAGIIEPSDGLAYVLGTDVCAEPDIVKKQIGYMSQKFALYDELTVYESLDFFGSLYEMDGEDRRRSIEEVLSLVQIKAESKKLVRDLSGGMRQRLALACALIHRPRLLLLDEPTAGVDPVLRRVFWSYFRQLVRRGVTVLLNSHYMDEASQCDRLGLLHKGRLIALGTTQGILEKMTTHRREEQQPTLEDAFITLVAASEIDH